MEIVAVDAPKLKRIGYDAAKQLLAVWFRNGSLFHFHGVPPECHAGLLDAAAPDRYLEKHIRGGPYQFNRYN